MRTSALRRLASSTRPSSSWSGFGVSWRHRRTRRTAPPTLKLVISHVEKEINVPRNNLTGGTRQREDAVDEEKEK